MSANNGNNLASEKTSIIILRRIEDLLCERVGPQKPDWESLANCLEAANSQITENDLAERSCSLEASFSEAVRSS
jgi:hypothetical protein